LEDESRHKAIKFNKNVDNKLQFVINYYLKMSKGKSHDVPNYVHDRILSTIHEVENENEKSRDDQQGKRSIKIIKKPSILDQCD
jgi:hypothetical protein